jgi:predicted HicB family RNase H-like nuclease
MWGMQNSRSGLVLPIKYKGYEADVELDADAGIFHGEVFNTRRDVITFQGSSVKEITKAFHDSIDDYLEMCATKGKKPETPRSTRLNISVPPEIARKILLYRKHQA